MYVSLREILKERLSEEEIKFVRRSFEIIGDIVIIEIPDEIMHRKDDIVEAILGRHKHVKTVLRKVGEVDGVFRIAKYELIYGERTETVVKEHGCRFLVDPTKVYYSVKLSGERERVAKLVREGERVLVMFAGVGPYPIVIAKLAKPKEVVGVELNPVAVEYFRKNVRLNKVEDVVRVVEGDVNEVVPTLPGKFDRILMPAPHSAEKFVHLVRDKVVPGSVVHYYSFESENEERNLPKKIAELFAKYGIGAEVRKLRKCGNFAPYVNRYVADVEVLEV